MKRRRSATFPLNFLAEAGARVPNGLPSRPAFQAMPSIAMVLVVMLLGVLLWLLHRSDQEEERLTLIKDILWVEQNIHFHLTSDEEKLAQLAGDLGRRSLSLDLLENSARALIANNPEFERLLLRDIDGQVAVAVPPSQGEPSGVAAGEAGPWWPAFLLARSPGGWRGVRLTWCPDAAPPSRRMCRSIRTMPSSACWWRWCRWMRC
uniref:Signal transduction histidine kinase n=1 Tax=Magnetospirillum gryphiswaldense TaxID=55518 RepID=A4TZC2_9PROT|nr:Signal transduction histidine kinase [Magnetospirillum gryphiswaldense MSR-1]